MIYIAIAHHSPDLCPGTSRENSERANKTLSQIEAVSKELGVTLQALHILLPGHKSIAVIDAPDYETANRFIFRLGLDQWNDVELHRSYTPEETIPMTEERFTAAG